MTHAEVPLSPPRFGQTLRRDRWWASPVIVFLGLSLFIVYSTWAAFPGSNYAFGNYLSPFYSPEIFGETHHALLGPKPSWRIRAGAPRTRLSPPWASAWRSTDRPCCSSSSRVGWPAGTAKRLCNTATRLRSPTQRQESTVTHPGRG